LNAGQFFLKSWIRTAA